MPTFLEIAVNVPQVMGVFHYHLPEMLEGKCHAGHLVEVQFGHQMVQGVVLRQVDQPAVADTRPVAELIDPAPVVTPAQISLALELSEHLLTPLAQCISLMLPPGLSQQADTLFWSKRLEQSKTSANPGGVVCEEPSPSRLPLSIPAELSDFQKRLLKLLERRGPLRGRQIDAAFPKIDWRSAARNLVRKDILGSQSVLPAPTVRPKYVRTVQLACPPEKAEAEMPNLGRAGSKALKRRQAILRFLMGEPEPVDVTWAYAESGGDLSDLRFLAELDLVVLSESEVWRDPLETIDFVPIEPPPLTSDQQRVWEEIQSTLQAAAGADEIPPMLLHGVTGSGKTEIYLRAVAETIRLGRQAIVLVPEIALTPQTVRRFISRFPGQVGLLHSSLSPGERFDTWRRARSGDLKIVIGPRSALFTPFPDLGLVVVDEFHDDSYYQGETQPHYHARETAVAYTRLAKAVCLLGSATPDVASYYQSEQGRWRRLDLPVRILAHRQVLQAQTMRLGLVSKATNYSEQADSLELPPVQVIDMRQELKAGNSSIFSRPLQQALRQVLDQKQQAILFLNRRGTATFIFCRDCGYALKCPRCDLPLTYHLSPREGFLPDVLSGKLICHHCDYRRNLPKVCPQCGSDRIRKYGTGTERVEAEVKTLLPDARTLRWDYETTRKKGAHEIILSHFANHRADILVGTQMIAKGLDLPLVTLVGVVLADVGLNLPDYRANERTFQLLTQVAGRAGRSPLGGQVILQSFQPDHYVIQAAAQHDYGGFFQRELSYRRHLKYPPFSRLVRLEFQGSDFAAVEASARQMAALIRVWMMDEDRRATEMIGPVPCFFARTGGIFRWQIILRGPDPASLLKGRQLGNWQVEVNPVSLL